MTKIYLELAKEFMTEGDYECAKIALCKALGHSNREHVPNGAIFAALNHLRGVC